MSYYIIDPKTTGVLFFDMLNRSYANLSDTDRKTKQPMIDACVKVRHAADEHGIPVFFARADHRPDGLDGAILYTDLGRDGNAWSDPEHPYAPDPPYIQDPENVAGHWGSQVIDALNPSPKDYIIAKHRWNAFHETCLELSMRTRSINTIVLCGGATHVGIASTVYGARDKDFNLVLVTDAVSGGRPEVHAMFMSHVFPRMARMRTSDEVLEMMRAGAAERVAS